MHHTGLWHVTVLIHREWTGSWLGSALFWQYLPKKTTTALVIFVRRFQKTWPKTKPRPNYGNIKLKRFALKHSDQWKVLYFSFFKQWDEAVMRTSVFIWSLTHSTRNLMSSCPNWYTGCRQHGVLWLVLTSQWQLWRWGCMTKGKQRMKGDDTRLSACRPIHSKSFLKTSVSPSFYFFFFIITGFQLQTNQVYKGATFSVKLFRPD